MTTQSPEGRPIPPQTVPESDALPAGIYPATFGHIEARDTKYGESWRWTFHTRHQGANHDVSSFTSTSLGPTSKANRWVSALIGRALTPADVVDFAQLAGATCQLVLIVTDDGWNRIEEVRPAQSAAAPVAPVAAPVAPAAAPVAPAAPNPQTGTGAGFVEPDQIPF